MLWAEGIPVKSQLVQDKCGGCHTTDSQQRMSRISYQRKTPEGWEETVRRMVQLHKVSLTPADARAIVQYLGDQHGLTASEVDKISYALEQREDQEQIPNEAVRTACATCHSYARIAAQRRTKEEWLKLKSFLLAIIPTIVYQHRYMDWMKTSDEALAYLAQQFPLKPRSRSARRDRLLPVRATG
jgi:quinohemoprotein amine dehydrogenase